MRLVTKLWLSGFSVGAGIALVVDKVWWKNVAVDLPDHYGLGVLLVLMGYLFYRLSSK